MNKTSDDNKIVRDLGFSLLSEGTTLKIKADGYSMYPSIKPGTTIFIGPQTEYTDLVPGEIIAWKRESGFVVHRFIRIENRGNEFVYFTRGDSSKYEDKPVTRDHIAGKVIRVEDRKHRIREGSRLIKKPCYSINMIIVWIMIKIKRIYRLFLTRSTDSITILMLIAIPLCSFVISFVFLCGLQPFNNNQNVTLRSTQRLTKDFINYSSAIFYEVPKPDGSEI